MECSLHTIASLILHHSLQCKHETYRDHLREGCSGAGGGGEKRGLGDDAFILLILRNLLNSAHVAVV